MGAHSGYTGFPDNRKPPVEAAEPLGISEARLAFLLQQVLSNESNYDQRRSGILAAMVVADSLGFVTGYRIDPKEPDWPVAYIKLPQGQVSWHMPQFPEEWDGHTTEEKHLRIARFCHLNGWSHTDDGQEVPPLPGLETD